jgi:hypothetical protein
MHATAHRSVRWLVHVGASVAPASLPLHTEHAMSIAAISQKFRNEGRPSTVMEVSQQAVQQAQEQQQVDAAQPSEANSPPDFLAQYGQLPKAREDAAALGFPNLPYASTPPGPGVLITEGNDKHYIVGAVGTPPRVGELSQQGIGHFLNPDWQQEVADAAARNGGLGTSEDGFLAFSKDMGFVRLRHTGLTPEQNRRLAEISLATGWPIERLPCRNGEPGALDDVKMQEWVDGFITDFDQQMTRFLQDPTQGVTIKDGSRNRYVFQIDQESGVPVSYQYRKAGGLKGWAQKNLKIVGPILDAMSVVAGAMGFTPVAVGLQATKAGLVTSATGKLHASSIAGIATAGLGGAGLSTFNQALSIGAVNAGAQLIDTGSLDATAIAGLVTPFVAGLELPGGVMVEQVVKQSIVTLAKEIDGKQLGFADFWGFASPLLVGVARPADAEGAATTIAEAIDRGDLTGTQLVGVFEQFLASHGADGVTLETIRRGLSVFAQLVDSHKIDPRAIAYALSPALQSKFQPNPAANSRAA